MSYARSVSSIPASTFIPASAIDKSRAFVTRGFGFALIAVGYAGTAMSISDDPKTAITEMPTPTTLAVAAVLQLVITYVEWAWRKQRMSLVYQGALWLDVWLTAFGLAALLYTTLIVATGSALYAALVLAVVAMLVARQPEVLLIDEGK